MRQNAFALCAVISLLGVGCVDNQVGRPCNNLGRSPMNGVSFVNPAPDCPTRLCMVTPPPPTGTTGHDGTLSICTAECQVDADCETGQDFQKECKAGRYVCAVPSVVPGEENFCCKKLCVCADDLIAGFNKEVPGVKLARDDYDTVIPTACDAKAMARLPNGQTVTRREKTCRVGQ
jgi:hypothetical protein